MPQNRDFFPVKGPNIQEVDIDGRFTTNGSGAVGTSVGRGFTVTKPAATTGVYRVTLQNVYRKIITATATIFNQGTAILATVQCQAITASTGVIDFLVLVEGAGTLAAGDLVSGGINFHIKVSDSSVP